MTATAATVGGAAPPLELSALQKENTFVERLNAWLSKATADELALLVTRMTLTFRCKGLDARDAHRTLTQAAWDTAADALEESKRYLELAGLQRPVEARFEREPLIPRVTPSAAPAMSREVPDSSPSHSPGKKGGAA